MSAFQVSDVQEKSSKLKVKTSSCVHSKRPWQLFILSCNHTSLMISQSDCTRFLKALMICSTCCIVFIQNLYQFLCLKINIIDTYKISTLGLFRIVLKAPRNKLALKLLVIPLWSTATIIGATRYQLIVKSTTKVSLYLWIFVHLSSYCSLRTNSSLS